MNMKKMTAWALSLAMAFSLMPASALAAEENSWQDGTYTGTGSGYGGDVVMEVTIKDGSISDVKAVSHEGENFWVVYESELDEMIQKIKSVNWKTD